MKNIALTVFAILALASCTKKKDDPKPIDPGTGSSEIAKLNISANGDQTLKVTISYSDKNTSPYLYDVVRVYYMDTLNAANSIAHQGLNVTTSWNAPKYKGGGYKITLSRMVTTGNEIALTEVKGN